MRRRDIRFLFLALSELCTSRGDTEERIKLRNVRVQVEQEERKDEKEYAATKQSRART